MSAWELRLDPAAVALAGRTELDLNSGAIAVEKVDWGAAAVKQFLSEQRFGESSVGYRIPNRTITITLGLGMIHSSETEEEARRKLEQKVALFQRQGGVLLRQREGGEPLYADIVDASLTIPDVWGETAEVEPNVVLTLTALPDFYGEPIELDAIESEGQVVHLLEQGGKQAVIAGDYLARTRIIVTEKSNHNQRGLLWGLRSTHYDAAGSAGLFYDGQKQEVLNGSSREVTKAGTYSGKWLELKEPQPEVWHPFMATAYKVPILGTMMPLTHVGSYRVWARVQSGEVNMRLRLAWSLDDATIPVYNAAVTLGAKETFQLVDLGEIHIEEPPVGEHWWRGILQVNTGPTSNYIGVDRIWFQPVDDGAGKLRATADTTANLLSLSHEPQEGVSDGTLRTGAAWTNPSRATAGHTGEYAEVTYKGGETPATQALALKKLGFAVPAERVITGIKVTVSPSQVGTGHPAQMRAELIKASAKVGEAKFGAPEGVQTLGGPSDLWGTALTVANVNEAAFGVAISFSGRGGGNVVLAHVPAITVTVYYTFAGTTLFEDAVLYAERHAEARYDGAFREDPVTEGSYVPVTDQHGDLPRLPPSGLEGRPCQLLLKQSRGTLTTEEADGGIDKVRVQVIYRPTYLARI